MKITKLSSLISSFSQNPAVTPVEEKDSSAVETESTASQSGLAAKGSEEAAKVASSLGSEDPEKVKRIKAQVDAGTYKVDSTKVAEAFIKDIASL